MSFINGTTCSGCKWCTAACTGALFLEYAMARMANLTMYMVMLTRQQASAKKPRHVIITCLANSLQIFMHVMVHMSINHCRQAMT